MLILSIVILGGNKTMMHDKTIPIITTLFLASVLIIANIQNAEASSTFVDGQRAGKAKGHSDAMSGRSADARCGSGHSNDYCAGYKIAYNVEYYWTKLVQDQK
jgi:hypothetical protein